MMLAFALFSILALLYEMSGDIDVCIQRSPECDGSDEDCSRSVPCHQGHCDNEGYCLCQRCWDGPNCNRYVDLYAPKFSTKTRSLVVSAETSGTFFTLDVQDADDTETCHGTTPCSCSEMTFAIVQANQEGLFEVDPALGHLTVAPGKKLVPGTHHKLVISVKKARASDEEEMDTYKASAVQEVDIKVLSSGTRTTERSAHMKTREEISGSVLKFDDGHHIRKRAASADPSFQMFEISGHGNTLSVGDRADFRLEITLSAGYSTDMVIEVLSSDPENKTMAFAMDHVELQPFGSAITESANVQLVLLTNEKITDLTDQILIDFGTLTTASDASSQDLQIVLTFAAVLISNPTYVVNGNNYSIVAGVSYDNESTIWVSQASYTAEVPPDDIQPYPSSVSVDGPDSIPLDSYGLYTIHVYSTMPYGKMQIDVFGNDAPLDSFSAGPIVITKIGANYMCMRGNLLSYPYVLVPSSTQQTIARSTMNLSRVINTDDQGRKVANTTENEMIIQFTIHIPNLDTLLDVELPFSASVMIGNATTIWTNIINVTVTERQTGTADPATMSIRNSTVTIGLRSSATFLVDILIPEGKYSDVILEVAAPPTAQDPPPLSICGVTRTFGANIPFVPFPDPQFMSRSGGETIDQMVVNLGRIWSTAMLSGNDSANTLTLAVTVKAETQEAAGQSVSITLTDTEGGAAQATGSVTVQLDDMDYSEMGTLNVRLSDALNSSSLAIETDVSLQMALTLDNYSYVDTLTMEVMTALDNETTQARVCQVEVSHVAQDLPCVNRKVINGRVQYRTTKPDDGLIDSATMELGSVCLGESDTEAADQAHIIISVAFELPQQTTALTGQSYTIYGGFKIGSLAIWAGAATYQIANSVPDIFSEGCRPDVEGFASPTQPPSPGSAGLAFIRIKLPPQSRSSYKLRVTSAASENFAICRLIITYLGQGFPCVDSNPWPGNTSRAATTRIGYGQFDTTLQASRSAFLDFGAVSNFGDQQFSLGPINDDNTILVAVAIMAAKIAVGNLTLQYALDVGRDVGGTQKAIIPLSTGTLPTMTPGETNISTLDGNQTVHVNVTKVVVFNLQIVPGASAPISVDFTNPNMGTNDYVFCSAAVTFVGRNIPCLNASFLTAEINNAAGDNCSNSLTMSLGEVCYIPIVQDPSEDWVKVEVGVNILDPKYTGTITIHASANVGGFSTPTSSLELTVINTELYPSTANITLVPLTNDSIPAPVRADTWVDVNITIPKDATVRFVFTATADSSDGRAIAVVKNIKVLAAGVNVACVKNSSRLVVEPNTSSSINTTQKDQLTVDFGYITNAGFTYRQGFPRPCDDQFTLSILVQMTDHPKAEYNAQIPLNFMVETDSVAVTSSQLLMVVRNGSEKADILAVANVVNPKLFRSNELVQVHLLLSHTEASLAEPKQTVIRLYLPQYMNYSDNLAANTTVAEVYGSAVSLQLLQPILFEDISEINFTLTVDPYGKRKPGAGMINATSIGRVLVQLVARTIEGVRYPATDSYSFCGKGFFLVYGIDGEGCHSPLGMESGEILDCQLSASTVASADQGPNKARLGAAAGTAWKPALRDQTFRDFFQVDFGNRTRVVKIAFQKDDCCRAPMSVLLQYSETGFHWSNGYEGTALNYTDGIAIMQLAMPFEGRMLKLVIQDADEPQNKDIKYIGLRAEFYGCVLGGSVTKTEACSKQSVALQSDSATQYRHFSVNTQTTAIYTCDISATDWKLGCFCSKDGTAWKIIPSYITKIVGYDPVTAFTFATNHKNSSVFKSADCQAWIVSTEQELVKAQLNTEFLSSQVIAGLPRDDPEMTKTVGTWKANFDGLYLSEEKKLSWTT